MLYVYNILYTDSEIPTAPCVFLYRGLTLIWDQALLFLASASAFALAPALAFFLELLGNAA